MSSVARAPGFLGWIAQPLEIPPPPAAPWGDPQSVRVFRAASGYRWWRRLLLGWKQTMALAFIVLSIFGGAFFEQWIPFNLPMEWWVWIEWIALILFLPQLVFAIALVELDWRHRWYLLTDRSLRIREGLFQVREMTISLVNVQQISLRQGPIQRLFGIADVEVRTAGGGSGGEEKKEGSAGMHVGRLTGIADAEQVRDEIVTRWNRVRRDQTETGHAEIPAAKVAGIDDDLATVAERFAAEARALGAWVTSME